MDIVFTDASRRDLGMLQDAEIDVTYGNKGNDFELRLPIESPRSIPVGGFVYLEGTEYGGVVDEEGADRTAKRPVKLYRGRTWHGILAGKTLYRENGEDIELAGDAHAAIRTIVSLAGLDDLFEAPVDASGIAVSCRIESFTDAYTGLRRMLGSSSAKLAVSYNGSNVILSAKAIASHTDDELDSDLLSFKVSRNHRPVNHLICLGSGNGAGRAVVHLYADAEGAVSQVKTLSGVDEVSAVFEYDNAELDELIEKGTDQLAECQNAVECDASDNGTRPYDVDDVVSAYQNDLGLQVSASVIQKSATIDRHGESVSYEIGEIGAEAQRLGSSGSSGGSPAYTAGKGIFIEGTAINAEVDAQDVASVEALANNALAASSDAKALAGSAQLAASAAVKTIAGSALIIASRNGEDVVVSHAASGIGEGPYGPLADATASWGAQVTVGPQLTLDAAGHVASAEDRVIMLPTLPIGTESSPGVLKPDGVTITVTDEGTIAVSGGDAAAFLSAHPIGSVFETSQPDDPASSYGGTWKRVPSLGAFRWRRER